MVPASRDGVSGSRTNVVNRALAMPLWRSPNRSAMAPAMQANRTRAGGCFLTLFILIGFVIGLAYRNPLGGSLIGVGVGGALALLVWLLDRRRSGDPSP